MLKSMSFQCHFGLVHIDRGHSDAFHVYKIINLPVGAMLFTVSDDRLRLAVSDTVQLPGQRLRVSGIDVNRGRIEQTRDYKKKGKQQ